MEITGIDDNSIIDKKDLDFYKNKYFLFTSTLKYMNKYEKQRLEWILRNCC